MGKIERIQVPPEDRERLARLVRDRNTPQKVVWRSQIVLSAAATAPWAALVQRAGVADWLSVLALFAAGLQIVSLFYLVHPASRAWFGSQDD